VVLVVLVVLVVIMMLVTIPTVKPMGVCADGSDFALPLRVSCKPLGRSEEIDGLVQGSLLILVRRSVLKTDQVDARDLQLQAQDFPVYRKVSRCRAVHVDVMLSLDLG
ncbi:MAG: hypothetical protein V2J20_02620, partial [Wenzhouxiangella sp.]|jgi:hypothetical protein|nr:hypothetical protein [Wenzhouxiangella sp.]